MQHDIAPNEARIYEAGLLLVPSLTPEQSDKSFADIKAFIEKNGGSFISEEIPTLRTLAYEMSKDAAGRRNYYTSAYFGWVKFEGPTELIKTLENHLALSTDILRSLIIKTVRENTLYSQRAPKIEDTADAEGEKTADKEEKSADLEMDKSIDSLVA